MKPNILIGLPCYSGLLHLDCLNSILDFHRVGLNFAVMGIGNESLIPRGRDTIISYFHYMKNFDVLFFLDADIGIFGADVIKLLMHEKDVIGAPVALKGYNVETGKPVYNTGKLIEDKGDGLITSDRIGTAVFLLSRKAVDALVRHAIENGDTYMGNPNTRGDSVNDMKMYNVFKTGVVDGEYLSEDYWACKTLKKLGFEIHVDTTVETRHNGIFCFQ